MVAAAGQLYLSQSIAQPPHQLQSTFPVALDAAIAEVRKWLLQNTQLVEHLCSCLGMYTCVKLMNQSARSFVPQAAWSVGRQIDEQGRTLQDTA